MKNRIRDLRAERGWSQAALAEQLNVSRQTVNAIETGRDDPACHWPLPSRACSASPSRPSSRKADANLSGAPQTA